MNATLAFLEKILPQEDDHWYVGAFFQNGRCHHRWYRDQLSLAADLAKEDAKGSTVYHACAAFRERKPGRKATNAKCAAALWSDIDAGEGKQFATAASAHDAMVAFCNSTGLPRPLFVCSGFGLHCYWPLGTSVDPQRWKRYSAGLGYLLAQNKIHHERTTDLASLLRPVGTTNRKRGVVPVKIIAEADGFEISDLGCLLDAAPQKITAPTIINGHTLAGKLGSINSRPRHSSPFLTGCKQLGYRDGRGYVPEPHWHLALGVFAFIDGDGDQSAHDWSSEDDRYNERQTQERLERIRASTSGATTCARFHQENPDTCEACPHWQKINSPIALCSRSDQSRDQIQGYETSEILNLPVLPEGYAWSESRQLCEIHEDKSGKQVDNVISELPISLEAIYVKETKETFVLHYRQFIRSRGWHDIVIDKGTLNSSAGNSVLSDKGANISDFAAFVRYSIAAVNMYIASDKELKKVYEQFGWKDNDTSFLYGLDLYTSTEIRKVIGDKNVNTRTGGGICKEVCVGPAPGGSLSGWAGAANKLFAPGAEAQSVAVVAGFGAVFHPFLSRDEGGSVISLVTHRGGKGKSTALAGALSIWGRKSGLSLENIDSSISKGASLASLGNLPMFYDQFDTTDPVFVRKFIDMFTNGRDKRRMGRDGAMADPGMRWQTCLFTASNASLVDSIQSIGNDALSSRIWEMSTDVPDHLREVYGEELKEQLRQNSGHAGAAFLAKLIGGSNIATAKHRIEHWHQIIFRELHLNQEYRFWVRMATSVAVAAEIISSGNVIALVDPERIVKWLVNEIKNRTSLNSNEDWPIEALAQFMADRSQNQLVVYNSFVPGQYDAAVLIKPMRELYIRREKANGRIYISKDELRRWCVKKGLNTREFIEFLVNRGICLNHRKNITLGAGTDYASIRTWCIEIDGTHKLVNEALGTKDDNVLPFARPDPNRDNSLGGMDEDLSY